MNLPISKLKEKKTIKILINPPSKRKKKLAKCFVKKKIKKHIFEVHTFKMVSKKQSRKPYIDLSQIELNIKKNTKDK
jgi:hypothetical protein